MTDKQRRFIDEYLIDLNATQAAIRAGYSHRTAQEQSARLLSNVMIQKEISKKMAERSRRTGVNQDRVVQELAKVAFVNIANIVDEHGQIRTDATLEDLSCIESIKYKESDTTNGGSVEREIKIASKLKALELLGKHLGMWSDKFNVTVEKSEKLDDIISQLGGVGLED